MIADTAPTSQTSFDVTSWRWDCKWGRDKFRGFWPWSKTEWFAGVRMSIVWISEGGRLVPEPNYNHWWNLWMGHSTPESKQKLQQWRKKEEPGSVEAKFRLSASKVVATVIFQPCGFFKLFFFHKRSTINAKYYYKRFQRGKVREVILLQDNACL